MDRSVTLTPTSWGDYREITTNSPGFAALLRNRDNVPLPQHDYFWWRVDGRNDSDMFNPRGWQWFRYAIEHGQVLNIYSGKYTVCEDIGNAGRIVQNALISKIRNTTVDLGVAMGEFPETCQFVATAATKVYKSLKQLRRGNVSGAVQTLSGVPAEEASDIVRSSANAWSAYSYGLRPLVKDVYDSIETYQRRHRVCPLVRVVRASASRKIGVDSPLFAPFGAFQNVSGTFNVTGKVCFRVTNPTLKTLDECGLVNPLSVAWELVPFSFVLDWFLPIGEFIENIVPPQGVDFLFGHLYTKGYGRTTSFFQGKSAVTIETYKDRMILRSFPRYHVKVPDISKNKMPVANAIALIAQQVVKGPNRTWYYSHDSKAYS